jgi:hypothetical protein
MRAFQAVYEQKGRRGKATQGKAEGQLATIMAARWSRSMRGEVYAYPIQQAC